MVMTKIYVLLFLKTHKHTSRILMSHMYKITNESRPIMKFIEKFCFCSRDLENSVNNKHEICFFY